MRHFMWKKSAGEQHRDVIGIAEGKQEAFRLTAQIMEEVLQKTGGFDVEAFFREEDFQSNEGIQER